MRSCMLPRIPAIGHISMQDRDCADSSRIRVILHRTSKWRRIREWLRQTLGERLAHFYTGMDARLDPPQQLHHEPVTKLDGRVYFRRNQKLGIQIGVAGAPG